MKIRKGFVSNSSSSSFTCNVCGENACGMDLGLEDADMFECVNGHTYCGSHTKDVINVEAMRKYVLDGYASDEEKEEVKAMNDDDFEEYADDNCVESEMRYEVPVEICPLCNFTLLDKEIGYEYLKIEKGTTDILILSELKDRFGNQTELKKFIKEKKENEN
jgi:hypothetical protein